MTMPAPDGGNRPRASRNVKLVLMGVAGAALLYSCSPAIGTAVGGFPGFWLFGNPFYRGANVAANCGPGMPGNPQCATGASPSSGSSGSSSGFRSSGGSATTSSTSASGSSATTTGQGSGASASQTTSTRGGFGSSASSHGSSSSS
jgi:hypothetical protein